jgi:hypothetical protein
MRQKELDRSLALPHSNGQLAAPLMALKIVKSWMVATTVATALAAFATRIELPCLAARHNRMNS